MQNETIKKYLADQLSLTERNAFEQEMENDEFLKESVEGFEMLSINDIKFSDIKTDINKQIDTKVNNSQKGKVVFMNVYKLAAAACIIGVLSITTYRIFFTQKSVDEEQIYAAYFKPLTNIDANVRGENDESDEKKAANAYENEDYFAALNFYQKLVSNNPKNIKNNLFLGISYLATNQPKKAIDVLQTITQSEEYHFDIQWYLALAYIKNKEIQNAQSTLSNLTKEENYYQKEAQEIIEKLDGKVAIK